VGLEMNNVKIIGTGSYVPPKKVSNDELSKLVDTSDEWIISRTGIKERRISTGENTSELAAKAALKALENSNVKPEDLDLIILATITPDAFMPSTACLVQAEIGAVNALCFDITAACSGFLYGLDVATAMLKSSNRKTALVIGAETISKILDWKDRSTCVLFGDGAGAAVLKISEDSGISEFYSGSDGTKGEFLTTYAVSLKNPFVESVSTQNRSVVKMNGSEIFKFASRIMIECIQNIIRNNGEALSNIKYIIPHQANYRIIEYTAKKLGIDVEKFFMNLDRYGNTSSASIPMALDELNSLGHLKSGDKIILVGFGGGLTYASVLITWK
jgi:3-oxoacyl-[acyl-carrier-protein] synthase III